MFLYKNIGTKKVIASLKIQSNIKSIIPEELSSNADELSKAVYKYFNVLDTDTKQFIKAISTIPKYFPNAGTGTMIKEDVNYETLVNQLNDNELDFSILDINMFTNITNNFDIETFGAIKFADNAYLKFM